MNTLQVQELMRVAWKRATAIAFSVALGINGLMISQSNAGQRISLNCRFAQSGSSINGSISETFCAALAQHLQADLGLSVTVGDGPGHSISLTIKPRTAASFEIGVRTAPLRGGAATTVNTVLVAHDSKITPFAARTLVRPIAVQLGIVD